MATGPDEAGRPAGDVTPRAAGGERRPDGRIAPQRPVHHDPVDDVSVLVVEDDTALRQLVARSLREHGLKVETAPDGTAALRALGPGPDTPFAAVVLDIGLPDSDGRDVCQALRSRGIGIPVLFLTAKDQLHDLLAGFAAGGDDHLAKPFHLSELLARLRALIRRGRSLPPPPTAAVVLDPAQHAVTGNGVRRSLTPTEFRLLAALIGNRRHGRTTPRARARRVAGRRDRRRQHPGPVRGAPPAQARRGRRRRVRHRHRPRRRVPLRVTPPVHPEVAR